MRDANEVPPDLARWLRALAEEVERDPALAARVAQAATPHAVDQPEARAIDPLLTDNVIAKNTPIPEFRDDTEALIAEILPTPLAMAIAKDPEEGSLIPPPTTTLPHARRSPRFGQPTVAGRSRDLGQGVPDPVALLAERGEDGLRAALAGLRIGTLRAMIRTYQLDPDHKLPDTTTERRLITAIVFAAKRANKPATSPRPRRPRAARPTPPNE